MRPLAAARPLGALLAALAATGCGTDAAPPPRHVLLIVLDATQAAQLACHGGPPGTTPVIDALAARGTRFAHAYSPATWTLPSTVSLLTGQAPERHGVATANHVAPPELELLPQRLATAGFDTAFFTQMVFASARHGLERGSFAYAAFGPGDDGRAALLDWAQAWLADSRSRSFLYVHLRRPHTPYDPPAEALAAVDPGGPADAARDRELGFAANDEQAALSDADRARVLELYRGNLRAADADVGALLAAAPPDTLVILTSDHGEGLGEHGLWGHGRGLWAEHVHIPLVVAGPGIAARVVEQPVGTIDLAATLCELLGVDPLPDMDGRSYAPWLRGKSAPARRGPLTTASRRYPGETPSVALIVDGFFARQGPTGVLSLHDLEADPGQARDLAVHEPQLVQRQLGGLSALRDWTPPPPGAGPEPSEQAEADLRALGYVR